MKSIKKVGILTFQSSDNFGALLQAYGTYYTVKKLGFTPEIMNYYSPNKKEVYKILPISRNKSFKKNFIAILKFPLRRDKKRKSDAFRKEKLHLSKEVLKSFDDLSSKEKEFSKVIVGSDQVWNYHNTNFDKRYLLDFVFDSRKKVSYAPSFAVSEIEEKYQEAYAKLLRGFSSLSVRESTGKRIIRELIGQDVEQVLDPTLLLTKEEWEHEISELKPQKENYVLLYAVGNKNHSLKVAKQLAKENHLKLVIIANDLKDFISGGVAINPTILGYVNLIKHSRYVVTSSFHGLAFSVNLNKNFICCLDINRKSNSRQLSLLELTGLMDRLCYNNENIQINKYDEKTIEWSEVNQSLNEARKHALNFLKEALS